MWVHMSCSMDQVVVLALKDLLSLATFGWRVLMWMPRKFGQSENLGIPDIAFLLLILFLPLRFFGGRTITSVLHHIFMAFLQKMFSSCMSCMTCPRVSCALHVLGRLPSSDEHSNVRFYRWFSGPPWCVPANQLHCRGRSRPGPWHRLR